jgi:hypothetical protein
MPQARSFLSSPFFATLPEIIQKHLNACQYAELKRMLLTLAPIIRNDKINDAAAVFQLSNIRNSEDFAMAYRAMTEDHYEPESVTTPATPIQPPYLPKLDQYTALIGGDM